MASLRIIKRRIRSIKNIQKITKALELVAASRMRRAQNAVQATRPYAQTILEMIGNVASLQQDTDIRKTSPLLIQRPVNRVGLILVTSDRGLAGSINTNVIRRATRFILEETGDKPVSLITVGRKGRDFMVRYGREVVADFINMGDRPSLIDTLPITRVVIDDYIAGKFDAVYLLYPEFVNTISTRPKLLRILPVEPPKEITQPIDYIFEPDATTVLNRLLPRYVEIEIYQAILETIASFQSSQMVAMRNATDKAKELSADLTLTYNKTRQANITREILEIAGASVMREG